MHPQQCEWARRRDRAVLLPLAAQPCVHVCLCARVRGTPCLSAYFLSSPHPMPDESDTQAPRPLDHRCAQPSCCIPGPAAPSTWPRRLWPDGESWRGGVARSTGRDRVAVGGGVRTPRAGSARPSPWPTGRREARNFATTFVQRGVDNSIRIQ
jgi:hypothetical protein